MDTAGLTKFDLSYILTIGYTLICHTLIYERFGDLGAVTIVFIFVTAGSRFVTSSSIFARSTQSQPRNIVLVGSLTRDSNIQCFNTLQIIRLT